MQSVLLPLGLIPPTRVTTKRDQIERWMVEDSKTLRAMAPYWVRRTSKEALAAILAAGNPRTYVTQIDGLTSGSGASLRGHGFHSGTIDQANASVRIQFIARQLADIANRLYPILRDVVLEVFPYSPTRRLSRNWSWWVQRDAHLKGSNTTSEYLGKKVPADIGMYDVLWLMPDTTIANKKGRSYAWSSLRKGIKAGGTIVRRVRQGKNKGQDKVFNRDKGWLAQATKRMRGQKIPGVTIQGRFIRRASNSRIMETKYGIPVIRLAFKLGLTHEITV